MKLSEFTIGGEFMMGDGRWRCTDIGNRVAVAIRIDQVVVTSSDGIITTAIYNYDEANAEGWFKGPPYAVAECVIDEDSMKACSKV